ncbi:MAG TPA: plasmid mobilization relaxosome protein MobC [Chitinophagaceae bacterium]|nr:plasmid mobilization relaxosome protein MobC [Chitinophagaceae bacterium]
MIREVSKIKHSGGRPKKQVKREIITGVRFTKVEYFAVKHKASKSGMKITLYIREMALQGKIISRLTEEERQFVRQLIGIANNINQLTKKGHQEGVLTAVLMFEKYRKLIDELLEKLKP